MSNNTPESYFERAKAAAIMLVNAEEDFKQLKADAMEELIPEGMPKEAAKELRADISMVFALAKLEARDVVPKAAAKIARQRRIAEACGLQLDLLAGLDTSPAQRMARAAVKAEVKFGQVVDPDTGEILSQEYLDGMRARECGVEFDDCPFAATSFSAEEWQAGWRQRDAEMKAKTLTPV